MVWGCMKRCCRPLPQRFVVSTMVLLAIALQFINRLTFEIALKVITQPGHRSIKEYGTSCAMSESEHDRWYRNLNAEFYWTIHEQADLLGAFYIGYTITQLPGGILSDSIGPKTVIGVCTVISGLCALLTPLCARLTGTIWVLLLNRIVTGLAQGPMFPAMSSFIARWAVPSERNIMSAYMNVGISVGAVYAILVNGFLLRNLESWDSVFYILGVVTILFTIPWYIFAHDSPTDHPFIDDEECLMINEGLEGEKVEFWPNPPFGDILKSVPVWAMVIANVGRDANFYVLFTLMPRYVDFVLHLHVMDHPFLTCGPFLSMGLFFILSAISAQYVLKKGWLSRTNQCKVWCSIANLLTTVFILLTALAECDRITAMSCIILAFGFTGFDVSSIWVVNVNLAPNHAGLLMGLLNGFGNLLGVLHPQLVAVFKEQDTVESWGTGFFITSCLVCLATLFFVILGSAELQPWNEPTQPPPPEVEPTPNNERTENENR